MLSASDSNKSLQTLSGLFVICILLTFVDLVLHLLKIPRSNFEFGGIEIDTIVSDKISTT